jgi:hypothetical protein
MPGWKEIGTVRTIPRGVVRLEARSALRVSVQIIPYDRRLVRVHVIPWNERLAVDACRRQADVGCNTAVLRALTCYLKPREPVSPRVHLLQVDKRQYVEICQVLLLDEFVYFKASP